MEIVLVIVAVIVLIIGAIWWYIESKISQAKELAEMAITGAKLGKDAYDKYQKKK